MEKKKKNLTLSYNIVTTPEKYFHQLIEILKIFPPFSKLRKRQRQTFAEILYKFYIYRNEEENKRQYIVFDYRTKTEIAQKLNITKGNLYNIYKELRKVNILTKEGINKKYLYEYSQFEEIVFKFKQQDTGKELRGNRESDSGSDDNAVQSTQHVQTEQ